MFDPLLHMRNVAYRVPLGLIERAESVEREGITYFRLPTGLVVKRVHVWGVVVHKTEGEDYVRLILDDFSGVVPVAFFGDEAEAARKMEKGDVVDVIGRLRQRETGISISGESIVRISPSWELVRRVENLRALLGVPQPDVDVEGVIKPKEEVVEEAEEEVEEEEVETLELGD